MTWMITITGRDHYLQSAHQMNNTPSIEEIAHALSMINRFNGHTRRPYSVAEHSLLVKDIAKCEGASPIAQMAALMHDAHEAFIGDVSSPVKWAVGDAWTCFEAQHEAALHRALGLRAAMVANRANLRRWDLIALATERRDLTAYVPGVSAPWAILDTPGHEVEPVTFHPLEAHENWKSSMTWSDWKSEFVIHYNALKSELQHVGGAMEC